MYVLWKNYSYLQNFTTLKWLLVKCQASLLQLQQKTSDDIKSTTF